MALQDVTYQNVQIEELPPPIITTITDILNANSETSELILTRTIVSQEQITIYAS